MTLDDLIEIEQVRQLKYAYFRCIDQKCWEELATLFTPDIEVRYGGGSHNYSGRDTVIEWLRSSMDASAMSTVCALAEIGTSTRSMKICCSSLGTFSWTITMSSCMSSIAARAVFTSSWVWVAIARA